MTVTDQGNAVRKFIRSSVQSAGAASISLVAVAAGLPGRWGTVLLGVGSPLLALGQNLAEDKGLIGTWLRRPTPATPRKRRRRSPRPPAPPLAPA